MSDLPPPGYEQTIEAIAQCDIPRANIRIAYQDYLQSDEITISDLGPVTEAKLGCLRNAVHPYYILTLTNEAQHVAYYEYAERVDRPKLKAEAREWLQSQGLLPRIPSFNSAIGLVSFATAIENACSLQSGSALKQSSPTTLMVQPSFLLGTNFADSTRALQCITQMFTASNADQYDIRLVFVGNEADSAQEEN